MGNRSKSAVRIDGWKNPKLEKVGIQSALIDAFGGVYDFSYHSKLNIAIRYILKNKEKIEKTGKIEINDEEDSFNWDEIITFANNFSTLF